MKNVLITGGTGSMGAELALKLESRGYSVTAFDVKPTDQFDGHNINVIIGDLTNADSVNAAVAGMDIIVHLAGIMPPMSEEKSELAERINTQGTKNIVDAICNSGKRARLVFSSSVSVYGDTTKSEPYISVDSPISTNTVYSKTKYDAENYILNSSITYTILRISAVFLAELVNPPVWPCIADQRVEFVYRGDVVSAIISAVETDVAIDKILLISGGESWQMTGRKFVGDFLEILGMDPNEAIYPDSSRYSDWYDTKESQQLLGYQNTSYEQYLNLLKTAVDEAFNW